MIEVTLLDILYLAGAVVALLALVWGNRAVSREFEALALEQEERETRRAGIEALVSLELKERGLRSTSHGRNDLQVGELAEAKRHAKAFDTTID